jgi:hypothetical protein
VVIPARTHGTLLPFLRSELLAIPVVVGWIGNTKPSRRFYILRLLMEAVKSLWWCSQMFWLQQSLELEFHPIVLKHLAATAAAPPAVQVTVTHQLTVRASQVLMYAP